MTKDISTKIWGKEDMQRYAQSCTVAEYPEINLFWQLSLNDIVPTGNIRTCCLF